MLWILDKGNDHCSPKIVSFNLIYNHITDIIEFDSISGKELNMLEIVQKSSDHESRAYIGNAGKYEVLLPICQCLIFRLN